MEKRILNDFTGGFSQVTREDLLLDNMAQEVINLEVNVNGVLEKRKGFIKKSLLPREYSLNSAKVVQGYLWNTFFKYEINNVRQEKEHILLVVKDNNKYYLYLYIENSLLELIKEFTTLPSISITDRNSFKSTFE